MRTLLLAAAAVGFATTAASNAHAGYATGTFAVSVVEGITSGSGFSAVKGASPFSGSTATASFTYTGSLNFSNTAAQNSSNTGDLNSTWFGTATNAGSAGNYGIANYSGSGTVASPSSANYTTLASFLASSGSASNYAYGAFYTIDLGVLAAGTTLTVTHDDGESVFQGNTQIGTANTGPTTVVTDTTVLTSAADTTLYYSRQNGSPSILQVAVPEPASLALLGAGLAGLGFARRRRARKTVA